MPAYIYDDVSGALMAWAPDDKLSELDEFTADIIKDNGWTKVRYVYKPGAAAPSASHWDVEERRPLPPAVDQTVLDIVTSNEAAVSAEKAAARLRADKQDDNGGVALPAPPV